MSVRSSLVRRVKRNAKTHLVIDFRYVNNDGREQRYRRDARVQTATSARAEADRLYARAVATGSLELRSTVPTFREFVGSTFEALFMPKYRPATRVRYRALFGQGILDAFGAKRLDAIGATDVRTYAAQLAARGVQPRGPINLVRTVLRAAVDTGAIEGMPTLPRVGASGRKLPDAPSEEELRAMLMHAAGWLRTAIALAALGGLRMGEVRALEVRDVDVAGERILVRHALSEGEVVTPKSGHERVVPLALELRDVLAVAIKSKLPGARVVLNARGRTPGRQHVLSRLKELQVRHKLPARSFHSLRHYFCSTLVRRGASVEAVRLLAGHSALAVTQRYVHANGSELRSAIAKLSGN